MRLLQKVRHHGFLKHSVHQIRFIKTTNSE